MPPFQLLYLSNVCLLRGKLYPIKLCTVPTYNNILFCSTSFADETHEIAASPSEQFCSCLEYVITFTRVVPIQSKGPSTTLVKMSSWVADLINPSIFPVDKVGEMEWLEWEPVLGPGSEQSVQELEAGKVDQEVGSRGFRSISDCCFVNASLQGWM